MANEMLIELNEDELLAVSGGIAPSITVFGFVQSIYQTAAVVQYGGDAVAALGGSVSFTQTLSATITQAAANEIGPPTPPPT